MQSYRQLVCEFRRLMLSFQQYKPHEDRHLHRSSKSKTVAKRRNPDLQSLRRAADAKRIIAAGQTWANVGARFLPSGWRSNVLCGGG